MRWLKARNTWSAAACGACFLLCVGIAFADDPKPAAPAASPEPPAAAPAPSAAPAEQPAAPAAEPAPEAKPEEAPKADASAPPQQKKWISGEFDAGFDGIWSRGGSEVDLDQTLKLNLEIPGYDKLHVRSEFMVREDIDSDNHRNNPLRDLDDTTGSDIDADVLHLYLDIDDIWGESVLRIGRQRILEGPSFARIDGAYFKKDMGAWDWYVFAGTQASLYDQSFKDPAAGGGVAWQISSNTRVALDAYWLKEDRVHYTHYYRPRLSDLLYRDYPRGTDSEVEDSVVSLSVWQAITENLRLMARLDLHDASSAELTVQATGYVPKLDVSYELTYRGLYDDLGDRASDLSSLYRVLGPEEAYDDLLLVLHRPITKKITLSLEGEVRDADDYQGGRWDRGWNHSYWDQAYYYPDKTNQDYWRYAAILDGRDLVWGLNSNIRFEYWDSEEFEDSWNIGGEVSKTWDALTVTFGMEYSRYESLDTAYNIWPYARNQFRRAMATTLGLIDESSLDTFYYDNNFTVNLRDVKPVSYNDDIFAIYLEGKWAFRENQTLSLGVTYEDDDTDDSPYWRVRAGYAIKF